MKAVGFTTQAMREERKLPARVQTRIDNALRRYAKTGEGDVKRLAGIEGFRLRVGDYRVLFIEASDAIEVRAVRHRKDAYRWDNEVMSKPQIIRTQSGEELVVLSRRDYDSMRARLGDEEAEDAMDTRILKERAGDVSFPLSVWDEIDASPSPVRPLRRWRKLTQEELAAKAGISQGYLSEIETGRKTGDVATLRAIATALGVGLDDVTPE